VAREAEDAGRPVVLVGESFGTALALRVVAAVGGAERVARLVLVNSGTAVASDPFLNQLTALLPLLWLDGTGKLLYKAAALLLYKSFLVDESRLRPECVPGDGSWLARSVNIDAIPLDLMLHRVNLLRTSPLTFGDECMARLVTVPTTIVAAARDKLLGSQREADRLAGILPNVDSRVLLKDSAHACLLESDVSLMEMIPPGALDWMACSADAGDVTLDAARASDETFLSGPSASRADVVKVSYRGAPRNDMEQLSFDEALTIGRRLLAPWRALVKPTFRGKENVADAMHEHFLHRRPVLFVGNHG
jgi:hypothetical protein